jgi:sugar phosphate isomerase/epimerase
MKINYLCPFWGMEGASADQFIDKVIEAGYDGVEVNAPDDAVFQADLMSRIESNKLVYVAQQWLPPANESVEAYIQRMERLLLKRAASTPVFINSHTGKDYFSFSDNCKIIDRCIRIEEETGIPISHETHRGRFNYSAAQTARFLQEYPTLRLSADFSHWVTVSESLLEDQHDQVAKAIHHSHYIHARVGNTQTPQVMHPFAPDNQIFLDTFTHWWQHIVTTARNNGVKEFCICPEFGPWPYMPTVPFTNMPIANQWELNVAMMNYLREVLV